MSDCKREIVLASASPRRRELLGRLGLKFSVRTAAIDEQAIQARTPEEATARVAVAKAEAVHRPHQLTIGADTAVVLDGEVLGKPRSPQEAVAMLRRLRGRWHRVLTAVAVLADGRWRVDVVSTDVLMRGYTDQEIAAYVAGGDPFDKAGAYAVQSEQFHPVACIKGCYLNVVGLPLCHLARLLREEGVDVPNLPPGACEHDLSEPCPVAPVASRAGEWPGQAG